MLERNNNPLKQVTLFVTVVHDPTEIDFEDIENALIGSLTWVEGAGEVKVYRSRKDMEEDGQHSRLHKSSEGSFQTS